MRPPWLHHPVQVDGRSRGKRLALVMIGCALAAPVSARAEGASPPPAKVSVLEPIHEAQRRFNQAVTLYQEEDLRGALAEFKGAYKIDPVYRVLYNLGLVSRELNDWAAALAYYRKYLGQGEERVPPARRLQVEREILELAQRVARLEIEVRDGPAEVQVDEQTIDPIELEEGVLVNPGRRRVRVSFPGRPVQVRTVEVASGDHMELAFEPPAAAKARTTERPAFEGKSVAVKRAAQDQEGEDPPNWPGLRSRATATPRASTYSWTATGALLLAAAATGYFAHQASDTLATDRLKYPINGEQVARDKSHLQMLATTADGLLVGGILCAVVSSYLTWSF
jgi:tetratricopeptide (TPR) repeat protein